MYHKCPFCSQKLNDKEIYMLSYEKKKTNIEVNLEDKKKDELINEIGTKLANLVYYLKAPKESLIESLSKSGDRDFFIAPKREV